MTRKTPKTMTYEGGIQSISVVLPTRVLAIEAGDTVEVSADEADRLADLPGWKAVKTPTPNTSEGDK